LTRQAGKPVRALQAGAQGTGIVWNNRHGRLFSRLRIFSPAYNCGLGVPCSTFCSSATKNTSRRWHDDLTLSICK
jgi:hypothetical protein